MSPTPKETWLYRLRWLLLLGAFVGFRLVQDRYRAYRDKQDRAQTVRQAQRYLEASNPARRRAGLWPIMPKPRYRTSWGRTYIVDPHDPDVRCIVLKMEGGPRWPRLTTKVVGYDPEQQQLLWEMEDFDLQTLEHPHKPDFNLRRIYSYRAAAQGRNPWTHKLHYTLESDPRNLVLSKTQADSVLRTWRVVGQRDSLAAVAQSSRHK